jgi:hypothetical protein
MFTGNYFSSTPKALRVRGAQLELMALMYQVGEVGKDEIQIAGRRRIQREKPPWRSPDVNRTTASQGAAAMPERKVRIYKATASTAIATVLYRKPTVQRVSF